jgi:voltage-gated sodium channel
MFDMTIGMVIILNSIIIGVELTMQPAERSESPAHASAFQALEHVFLIVYIVEIAIRIFACGTSCLRDWWVRFDVFLIIIGIAGAWVLPLMIALANDTVNTILPTPMFLRVFRLARLARALRLFVQFRTLWMLVSGLYKSMFTVLNVFLVLALVLYIFSCIGFEVITHSDQGSWGEESQDLVGQYWSTLPMIMLTLVQFVTLDGIADIYKPLVEDDIWLIFYFGPFILVVSIILMNLVTAVVLENFLEQVESDHETRRLWNEQRMRELIPKLMTAFGKIDTDVSGQITIEELKSAPAELVDELENLFNVASIFDLFEALDVDNNLEVDVVEFFDGMSRFVCKHDALDTMKVITMLKLIRHDIVHVRSLCEKQFPLPDAASTYSC